MATPSTNIGLILIKDGAAAENIRVPPFILHALLRSVGNNNPIDAVNLAINANASNGRIINYIEAGPFQFVLNSLRVAETAKATNHNAEVYLPAIYYDIRTDTGDITAVTYVGPTNAITADANLKTIQFTNNEVNEYRKIWNTLPEGSTPPAAAAANDNFFATRIKLVTTIFSKIYEQLLDPDKKIVNDFAIAALNDAYDSTALADVADDAAAVAPAADNIGKAFIRFFKRVIIDQGMASQSFIAAAAAATASTSKADVELFTHYLNDTTVGASVLSNKVDITPDTRKNIELFFTYYLNAKKEDVIKGGFKRRRNRKSSKRRSQKKSRKSRKLRKRSNKRKGKKSRRRMRKSYKK